MGRPSRSPSGVIGINRLYLSRMILLINDVCECANRPTPSPGCPWRQAVLSIRPGPGRHLQTVPTPPRLSLVTVLAAFSETRQEQWKWVYSPPVPRGVCSPRQPTCRSRQLPSYCGCELTGTDPGLAPLCCFCGSAMCKGQLCPESRPQTRWEPQSPLPRPHACGPVARACFLHAHPGHAALYVGPQSRWRGSSSRHSTRVETVFLSCSGHK